MMLEDEEWSQLSNCQIAKMCHVGEALVRKMRPEICIDNTAKPQSAELPTTETPHQNWGETIQEVIQQEQEKAERRLAKERARMEATIREQGWTQERIGKALGVGKSTIQDWLKGKRSESVPQQNSDNFPTPTQNLEAIIAPSKAASWPQISAKAQAPTMRRKASWNPRR